MPICVGFVSFLPCRQASVVNYLPSGTHLPFGALGTRHSALRAKGSPSGHLQTTLIYWLGRWNADKTDCFADPPAGGRIYLCLFVLDLCHLCSLNCHSTPARSPENWLPCAIPGTHKFCTLHFSLCIFTLALWHFGTLAPLLAIFSRQ